VREAGIDRLAAVLGRDLSHWDQFPTASLVQAARIPWPYWGAKFTPLPKVDSPSRTMPVITGSAEADGGEHGCAYLRC
jgi:hypothetical protein